MKGDTPMGADQHCDRAEQSGDCQAENDRHSDKDVFVLGHGRMMHFIV